MKQSDTDNLITPDQAVTLAGLFRERIRRTPDLEAYRYHDDLTETCLLYTSPSPRDS